MSRNTIENKVRVSYDILEGKVYIHYISYKTGIFGYVRKKSRLIAEFYIPDGDMQDWLTVNDLCESYANHYDCKVSYNDHVNDYISIAKRAKKKKEEEDKEYKE